MEFTKKLATVPENRRSISVFHPSWDSFAKDSGLNQIPIESEGNEPSPGDLERIVKGSIRKTARVFKEGLR